MYFFLRNRVNVDEDALGEFASKGKHFLVLKGNSAVRKGEKGIIATLLHVLAGVKFGTTLANDDFARMYDLTAKTLYTKAF